MSPDIDTFVAQMRVVCEATTPTEELYFELMARYIGMLKGSSPSLKFLLAQGNVDAATTIFLWRNIFLKDGGEGAYWSLTDF